jgi:TonB family protein
MRTTRWISIVSVLVGGSIALADVPENLDRSAISAGISSIKPKVATCGQSAPDVKGTVKVKVLVTPAGTVKSASVTEAPDDTLGQCVTDVVKTAKFSATKKGGSFTYPFVF